MERGEIEKVFEVQEPKDLSEADIDARRATLVLLVNEISKKFDRAHHTDIEYWNKDGESFTDLYLKYDHTSDEYLILLTRYGESDDTDIRQFSLAIAAAVDNKFTLVARLDNLPKSHLNISDQTAIDSAHLSMEALNCILGVLPFSTTYERAKRNTRRLSDLFFKN